MTPENQDVGFPDRWASLFKQRAPTHHQCWRVSFAAGVLRVSSKLGSSHRTLTTPVEAYTPPCTASILPFWRGSTNPEEELLAAEALFHGAFDLAVRGLLGDLTPLVVLPLAAGYGDLELDVAVLGVELEGD